MEKQKSPEVRFKGFSDGWKQQTLGDMFIPLSNNTLSRADLNYDNGQIKNIHYGDILVKYAAVLDYKNDKIPFITDGKISDFKSQLLQNGDVIFADTAEDEVVGKAIEINVPADTFIVSGLHTMAYRPKAKLSSFYLGHYLNSNAYHHQLLPLMQGVKVLSISRTNLAKTIVRYPLSEQEQTQIGNFFQNLDQSIALHQKKLAQTQNLKKAMLEKMFPKAGDKQPEIRLKGFSGDWPGLRIFDLAQNGKLNNGVFNDQNKIGKGYKLINVLDMYIETSIDEKKLTLLDLDRKEFEQNKVKYGDVFFTRSSLVKEGIAFSNVYLGHSNDITYDGHLIKLSPNLELVDPIFLNYCLKSSKIRTQLILGGKSTTMTTIGQQEVGETIVGLPSMSEQLKIGQFFKRLDETLLLQQQKLQTLKNLKRAFLEKMFV